MNYIDLLGKPMYLNEVFESENKNKRFRIVERLGKYISKRVAILPNSTGSVGMEEEYNNFNEALKMEINWLRKEC